MGLLNQDVADSKVRYDNISTPRLNHRDAPPKKNAKTIDQGSNSVSCEKACETRT